MATRQLIAAARSAVVAVTETPRALTGLAIARIGIAVSQASLYTADYAQRHMLHGPDGVFPREQVSTAGTFNLYVAAGESVLAFEALYHLGLALCVAMALGVGGRAAIVGVWATSWSLWGANPMLIDGGDNVAMVVLPMLAVSMCCDRLSVRTGWAWAVEVRRRSRGWLAVLLSNAAAFGVMVQLCIVYFLSGMYKAQGEMWVDGTALYYIMRTPEYFYPPLSPLILENDAAIVVGTYAAMVTLIAFPFLVLSRSVRPWAVAAMLGFHASIGLFMGLTSFALAMMACDCVFVSGHAERAVGAVRARLQPALETLRRRMAPLGADLVRDPAPAPEPLAVPASGVRTDQPVAARAAVP